MEQQVVVITGASRGLGTSMSTSVAAAGAQPVLVARDDQALSAVSDTIHRAGGSCTIHTADVSHPDAMNEVVTRAVQELGRLDVFVNNAGIAPQMRVEQTSDENWDAVIELNLNAVFRSARALAPMFRSAGRGRLINIASIFGLRGRSGFSAHGSSKAAVAHITRVLAVEWANVGAQVNSVAPGYISTDINAEMRSNATLLERIVGRIPARRMGEADEVANLVRYLALDAPAFLTGQIIAIDGGESAT